MFQFEQEEDYLLIRPSDLLSAADYSQELKTYETYLEEGNTNILVDLAAIRHISSMGLGVLVALLTRARSKGGELLLLALSDRVEQLLVLTRLRSTFQICETKEEAKSCFQSLVKSN